MNIPDPSPKFLRSMIMVFSAAMQHMIRDTIRVRPDCDLPVTTVPLSHGLSTIDIPQFIAARYGFPEGGVCTEEHVFRACLWATIAAIPEIIESQDIQTP